MTNNTTVKFSGICQVCGRRQAVNAKGNIAKHGYSLEYGFFNGTCQGSDHLPFEQDKSLAVAIIVDVHDSMSQLRADAGILEAPAVPEADGSWLAWVHEYRPATWERGNRSGGYVWHRAPVVSFDAYVSSIDGKSVYHRVHYTAKFEDRGRTTKMTDVRSYSRDEQAHSEVEAVTALNSAYASALRRQADGLAKWIAWQEERVASWKVLPLEPRK